jgi:hypothetical protein
MELPLTSRDNIFMSKEALIANFHVKDGRNVFWTTDKDVELPIILKPGDNVPIKTIPDVIKSVKKRLANKVAIV